MSARAVICAVWCAASLGVAAPTALGQQPELSVAVDPTAFFEDEAAWLFATRVALGLDGDGEPYPSVGVVFGRVFPNHFYLAGAVDGRLCGDAHVRAGLRFGGWFRRRLLNVGLGTSLSLLAVPATREVGPVATAWLDVGVALGRGHALTLFAEADVLVEQLGFGRSRALLTFGLGWAVLF